MEKPIETEHDIHALLRRRWSPRAFAPRPVEPEHLAAMLEAARWAPSSLNEQPWRFLVATQDAPEAFNRLADVLMEGNRIWARRAPALILTAAKMTYERGGLPNHHAWHDVGAATAHLTFEATARGLFVHPMGGFDPKAARQAFDLPEQFEPVAVLAVGYPGDPGALPEPLREREFGPRVRRPLREIAFKDRWEQPLSATPAETRQPALA